MPYTTLACAISPLGDLVAVGGRDGSACVIRTDKVPLSAAVTSKEKEDVASRDYRLRDEKVTEVKSVDCVPCTPAHFDDVRDALFFPSGIVVATASADMSVKIWSAISGKCAAQLRGHTRGVLGVKALGRGRRVVTASADGTVRLWLLEDQHTLAKWTMSAEEDATPEAITVFGAGDTADLDGPHASIVSACWDGCARLMDVREPSKKVVAEWRPFGAIDGANKCGLSAVCSLGEDLLAFGNADGGVALCDWRQTSAPKCVLESRSKAQVNRLVSQGSMLFAGHADGMLWAVDSRDEEGDKWILRGFEGAPITGLDVAQNGTVLSCTRDGTLLMHQFPGMSTA